MRLVPFVTLAIGDLALGVSLAVGYGVNYGDCAPSSFTCLFGGPCLAVCVDARSQFPIVALFGMIVGLPFALVMHSATQILTTRRRPEHGARHLRNVVIASIASGAPFVEFFLVFSVRSFWQAVAGSMITLFAIPVGLSTLGVFRARREAVRMRPR